MRYALIKNNVVENVILGDEDFAAHLAAQGIYDHIEALDTPDEEKVGGPGWLYDPVTGSFTEPVIEEPVMPETWTITKLAFKNRFPKAKWLAARTAASSNVALFDFFESFDLAEYINLKDQETIDAVSSLSAAEVPVEYRLSTEEVAAVLTVAAQPGEQAR